MAFNFRRFTPVAAVAAVLPSYTEFFESDERGFAHLIRERDDIALPDPADYDIDTMVRAGVPLQMTHTSIVWADTRSMLDNLSEKDIFEQPDNSNQPQEA